MSEELIKNIRAQIHVTEKYRQLKALMLALAASGRSPPEEQTGWPKAIAARVETPKEAA